MEIGGEDIILSCPIPHRETIQYAICSIVKFHWEDLVIENDGEGVYRDWPTTPVPFQHLADEIFIYENDKAYNIWTAKGADPSVENKMIHVITCDHENEFTIVVGSREGKMKEILESILTFSNAAGVRFKEVSE